MNETSYPFDIRNESLFWSDRRVERVIEFVERMNKEQKIGLLKAAIAQNEGAKRVLQNSILQPRNAYRKAQDVATLASINITLGELYAELAELETVEPLPENEGETTSEDE